MYAGTETDYSKSNQTTLSNLILLKIHSIEMITLLITSSSARSYILSIIMYIYLESVSFQDAKLFNSLNDDIINSDSLNCLKKLMNYLYNKY